jgi:hypothetical protein
MSGEETPVTEWKTIRISATSYYKLVELSGLFTVIFGSQPIPIGTVAEFAFTTYYDSLYTRLKEIVGDPQKLEAFRKEFGGSMKKLYEVWTKPKWE